MSAQLKSSTFDQTLILTISNPESRNALGPEICGAGIEALNVAESSRDIHSVIITGEGSSFCSGGNLQRLLGNREKAPEVQSQSIDGLHNWMEVIRSFPKPVIASVEGAAAGAGFSLALMCDFVVAASDAVFVMAYSNIALSPDGGGSWSLGKQLPRQLSSQILMLGEKVSAQQLHKWGVINSITDPGQAFNKALELAERLNQRAPNSLASIKELLNESQELHLNQHLRQERDQFVKNLHHPNSGIGIQAFFDKTKPNYKE